MLGTVGRVGLVLDLFTRSRPEWGVSEVARQLELSKSQAYEMLSSLVGIGLLRRTDDARYRLGWRNVGLGAMTMHNDELFAASAPWMRKLVAVHGELSVHLAVWDVDRAVFVGRQNGRHVEDRVMRVSDLGNEAPIHCTSLGKVLAAGRSDDELDEALSSPRLEKYTGETITRPLRLRDELRVVRERGFATDQGELENEMMCIAAPVTQEVDTVVAAIGVVVPPKSWSANADLYMREVSTTSKRIAANVAKLRANKSLSPSPVS